MPYTWGTECSAEPVAVDGNEVPLVLQTVTEKHKLNVPETMMEVLDVSDEEGGHHTHTHTHPIQFNQKYAAKQKVILTFFIYYMQCLYALLDQYSHIQIFLFYFCLIHSSDKLR